MKSKTKWICVNALGIALFIVLTLCIQVPVFENYYLCLGYTAVVVYAALFGPVSSALTGSLGVILYCLLTNGLRGMPGWALGNVLIGLALGLGFSRMKKTNPPAWQVLLMGFWILGITAAAMFGVKSLTEHLLYSQPMAVRMAKNFYAFAADTVMMWFSLPIAFFLKARWKEESQTL